MRGLSEQEALEGDDGAYTALDVVDEGLHAAAHPPVNTLPRGLLHVSVFLLAHLQEFAIPAGRSPNRCRAEHCTEGWNQKGVQLRHQLLARLVSATSTPFILEALEWVARAERQGVVSGTRILQN